MKKEVQLLCAIISRGLYDQNIAAHRRLFNAAVIDAWRHTAKHGDVTFLQQIVDAHTLRLERIRFARELLDVFPLQAITGNETRLGLKKGVNEWEEPAEWPDFASSKPISTVSRDEIRIGGIEITPKEMLALIHDFVVLDRKALDVIELAELTDLIEKVQSKRNGDELRKKTGTTTS